MGKLCSFFAVLKSLSKQVIFTFVTGASKFAKTALFSGANNITDITYDARFNAICGFTLAEIEAKYSEYIDELAVVYGISREEFISLISKMYNGYTWDIGAAKQIYNPWSICHLFDRGVFDYFWADLGAPTLLAKLLVNKQLFANELATRSVNLNTTLDFQLPPHKFSASMLMDLLLQAGFLTINAEKSNSTSNAYLEAPNVETGTLFTSIIQFLSEDSQTRILPSLWTALDNGDLGEFATQLSYLFSTMPYDAVKNSRTTEGFFHGVLHTALICTLPKGRMFVCEGQLAKGRADIVVRANSGRGFIFEIKFAKETKFAKKQASDALAQVADRNYQNHTLLVGAENVHVAALVFIPILVSSCYRQTRQYCSVQKIKYWLANANHHSRKKTKPRPNA